MKNEKRKMNNLNTLRFMMLMSNFQQINFNAV